MYCLGRRDLLQPVLALLELTVIEDENGKPLREPGIGRENVVVSGITYVDGAERLTACNNLYEMQSEYAFYKSQAAGSIEQCWYLADKEQCELAHSNMMVSSA